MNYKNLLFTFLIGITAALFLQSCDNSPTGFDFSDAPAPYDRSQAVKDSTLSQGATMYVIEEGEGPFKVFSNDNILIQFTARIKDKDIFESTYRISQTQATVLPKVSPAYLSYPAIRRSSPAILIGQIKQFRKAIIGMKIGEKRSLVIKPSAGLTGRYSITGTNLQDRTIVIDFKLIDIFT